MNDQEHIQQALRAGALDVFHTPVQMKKNRPGVVLRVLCSETDADRFTEMMLRETTAFGVRRQRVERRKLRREIVQVTTPHGTVVRPSQTVSTMYPGTESSTVAGCTGLVVPPTGPGRRCAGVG